MKLIIDIEPRYCEDMDSEIKSLYYEAISRIKDAIRNGRPYEERPQGKWISEYDDFYHCSRCGHVICTEWGQLSFEKYFPFCHCGADMRKENET